MSGYQKMRAGGKKSEPKFKPNEEVTPITGFDTLTPEQTTSALKMAGTDTSSGDRESLRSNPDEDVRMAAWAKANPLLAEKVKSHQVGYEAIQGALGKMGYDDDATFTGKDIKEEYRVNLGSSGVKEITDMQTGVGADKAQDLPNYLRQAQDLLKNYQAQLSGNLSPLAEDGIPSESQNPRIANTDYTPIDSEIELSKAVPNFAGKMGDLNKNMSNRFRAF